MHLFTPQEQATPAIRARELSKRYGRRQAVSRLSFAVEAGQICALLGPNGAGKTSTMRMLVGLSSPGTGSASILGEPVGLGADVLRRVGVLIDGPAFVPHLTGRADLRLRPATLVWRQVWWRSAHGVRVVHRGGRAVAVGVGDRGA
ncbi:ATP-binding cassette domain-containing protein [Streptomyces sp. NPDC013172]|uniref:ATP-binding cassette domain-containing protein n=1 Tax=Streptomyces sp. NPDC013172 TaxID=3155009 RepID=UPI0033EA77E1